MSLKDIMDLFNLNRDMKFYLTTLLLIICAPLMMAYSPDNFLAEYSAEGYDMTFKDQHENIFLLLLGTILFFIKWPSSWDKENVRVTKFAAGAMVVFSMLNMALGVSYVKYAWIFLNVLIFICLILTLVFKQKFGSGKIFLSTFIFLGALIVSFFIQSIDYKNCDKWNQYPPEYGLQWRPFYQGFTDNSYFNSVEKKISFDDEDGVLYNLLNDEVHSFEYPFSNLKSKGWTIKQSGLAREARLFLNPDHTMGYVQIRDGGGLEPIRCRAYKLGELLPSVPVTNISDIQKLVDSDNIIVFATETNDTIKLYLKNLTHNWFNNFTNLKDSVLLLPDSEITNIIPDDYNTFSLNEDFYETSKVLSFPKDTIEQISYEGAIIRVKFKNPEALDKTYANNCMIFVDIGFENNEIKLHRY